MPEDKKHSNYNYNKYLKSRANRLRKSMTKAEACLWKYVLRAKNMKGYQFRRQRPVLNFIADFICLELKLIIEVDGITHQWDETKIKDEILNKAGYTVLRFSDNEILHDITNAAKRIEDIIMSLISTPVPPEAGHPRRRGTPLRL